MYQCNIWPLGNIRQGKCPLWPWIAIICCSSILYNVLWDSFGVGHTQSLILLHIWLDQHNFVISHFRPLVGSFSLTLCILISQKCAAGLNFFTLWVIPLICLLSADFTWWQIWLNKCVTEDAQRRIFLSIPIPSFY